MAPTRTAPRTKVRTDSRVPTTAPAESTLRIPVHAAESVQLRYAPVTQRDRYGQQWQTEPLKHSFEQEGFYEINLEDLKLPDGAYEYEFCVERRCGHNPNETFTEVCQDPYAEEVTRFGGYRGLFRIKNGKRYRGEFAWQDELPSGVSLKQNHQLVIYELPMRWMTGVPQDSDRQVGLGTFERTTFERLDELQELGINCIELLPVQDSADTLNWGYGTRFFYAPDWDLGQPLDMKYFVKQCHQRGIRVVLDVVMNHAQQCPLEQLDYDNYFLHDRNEEPGRGPDWGGKLFRYRRPGPDGQYPAREFHYQMAEHWIREYHVDGFRIDEFRGIDCWEFVQEFRDRCYQVQQQCCPGRPFLVVAEDSWRRAQITHDDPWNPQGRKVTDAMWNLNFRDETRRLMRNAIYTQPGQPSRSERIRCLISGQQTWDDYQQTFQRGFSDLAQCVNYLTSHDVESHSEQRILNYLLQPILQERWLGDGSVGHVRYIADHLAGRWPGDQQPLASEPERYAHGEACEGLRSCFGLLLTSCGIPMILAGDEFGDCQDLDHGNWQLKTADPVDFSRRNRSHNNWQLCQNVRELVRLRTSCPALQRNEVDFFYFHPEIDTNDGCRVFAYCRTGGQSLGSRGQVVVICNAGQQSFSEFYVPWHWRDLSQVREVAPPQQCSPLRVTGTDNSACLSLAPFQTRVFEVQQG